DQAVDGANPLRRQRDVAGSNVNDEHFGRRRRRCLGLLLKALTSFKRDGNAGKRSQRADVSVPLHARNVRRSRKLGSGLVARSQRELPESHVVPATKLPSDALEMRALDETGGFMKPDRRLVGQGDPADERVKAVAPALGNELSVENATNAASLR